MKTIRYRGVKLSHDRPTRTYKYSFSRGKQLVEEAVYFDIEPAICDALHRLYLIGKEAERNKPKVIKIRG